MLHVSFMRGLGNNERVGAPESIDTVTKVDADPRISEADVLMDNVTHDEGGHSKHERHDGSGSAILHLLRPYMEQFIVLAHDAVRIDAESTTKCLGNYDIEEVCTCVQTF